MQKSAWILVLGLVVLIGGLDAMGIIPLGIFGSSTTGDEAEDALTVDETDGEGAGLEGRATAKAEEDVASGELNVEPPVPAEVRGSTRNGASIRGRVVLAESGQPMSGVTVELRRPDPMFHYLRAEPKGRFDLLKAKTGRDGRFALLDLTPSNGYVVRCQLEDYAAVSSSKLDLRGGEREDLGDLALGPSGSIKARVVDAEGRPVADARVAVTWMVQNDLGVILADPDTLPEIERETKTAADGTFEIDGLEPGDKTLIAKAPAGAAEVIRKIGVQAGETTEAPDIKLSGNGVIAGTVTYDNGDPVAGARVFAGPNQQASLRTVESGTDGSFRVEWLPEGKHVIGVLVPGLPVKILMGQPVGKEDVSVVFPTPGRFAGVVVNARTGAAVTKFSILVEKKDVTDFQEQFVSAMIRKILGPRAFEDAEGTFAYEPLAPGNYKVTVSAPGYPDVTKEPVVAAAGDAREPIRFELPEGHTARGSVTTQSGDAVGRARLFVLRQNVPSELEGRGLLQFVEDREPDARTRPDGTFELPPQAPGKITIIATHESGLPARSKRIDMTVADVEDLTLVLDPAGLVTGQVLGEAGRPAGRGQVYVLYPDGTVFTEWIGNEGRFDFEMLPVGHCVVRWLSVRDVKKYREVVQSEDEDAKRAAYDDLRQEGGEHYIGAGREVKITIRLPRMVRFRGHLRVNGEAPRANSGIWMTIPEGAWGHWAECDEAGYFEANVESGKYKVWAMNGEGRWVVSDIEIPDQSTYTEDVER